MCLGSFCIGKPNEYDQPIADDVQFLDMALGNLLYSKQFLEESNQELRKERFLYQLMYSSIQSGSLLYKECLSCGLMLAVTILLR